MNFFQPTMKLQSKTRHGASVNKVYETAQTPYQRLLQSVSLSEAKRVEMAVTYHRLNPVLLLKQINSNLEHLWRLAEHQTSSGNHNYEAIIRTSVTV
jgi:ABC-type thiamine transport system ATPase subunit